MPTRSISTSGAATALFLGVVVLLCARAGGGCGDLDDLAALGSGDLSNPAAVRASPDGPLIAACGRGWETAAGQARLQRHPYLQRTTETSTTVVWTERGIGGAPSVVVTRPDGSVVATIAAEVDSSASPEGARQLLATVAGLEPGTVYCYAVRDGAELLVEPTGMRTAPSPGGAPVRFVAWGDSGDGGARQMKLLEQLGTVPFDFALVTGDVAYEHGRLDELERNFFGVYASLVRSLPVFPLAGNHDYATEHAAPFLEAFVLPENGGAAGRERFFSFDWGDVHFAALDTEWIGPTQAAWLDDDLADTDRPWKVVYSHKPPWSSGHHGPSASFQEHFVPVLERRGVALVLSGHDHDYERLHPIGGVHYVVTGGGGRETREVDGSNLTAYAEAVIHFVYVTVEGSRLALHAIDGVGREFDSLVVER